MASRRNLLRLVDANRNRASEGLRVCEDVMRFCGGSPDHVRRLRAIRHKLAAQIRALPLRAVDLVRARDSRRDVGRRFVSGRAKSMEQLLLMNLQRAKEALRVLEESARLIAPRWGRRFQRLRFELYDVERDLLIRLATVRHR